MLETVLSHVENTEVKNNVDGNKFELYQLYHIFLSLL